ncbi:MAG: HAD-IA family hydrolase [Clostridia bacterium]|nr:HAD-IA family hydrolase [Clostridia bacterium]
MRHYLFDFDGTLVDSMPTFAGVMRRILTEQGMACDSAILKELSPLGLNGIAERMIEMGVNLPKEDLLRLIAEYMMDEYLYRIPVKENVIEALRELKARGHKLSILTGSPHITLDPCAKRVGLWDLFDNIWSCDDFSTTKTNPDIYKEIAKKLGVPTWEILFFDDNLDGLRAAKEVGVTVCGVYDPSADDFAEEIKEIAAYYIRDFRELPRLGETERDFLAASFAEVRKTVPVWKEYPNMNPTGKYAGIKAIAYECLPFAGLKTKAFAYLGIPEKTEGKVPGIVLVHGGSGVAYAEWVHRWVERGYAAIAMSNCGHFPKTGDMPENENWGTEGFNDRWSYSLCGDFCEEGYRAVPMNDVMWKSLNPVETHWMRHAAAETILAANVLRSIPEVDADKIGLTGVSWGGCIVSVAMGYDDRFAFSIPVYGSGYQTESLTRLGRYFRRGRNPEIWLAEQNFDTVKMPTLWQCWNADTPFSLNSNVLSYLHTVKNNADTRLSAVHEMGHGHSQTWVRPESYVFADSVVKGGKRLPAVFPDGTVVNSDGAEIVGAKVYYLTAPFAYTQPEGDADGVMTEAWKILPLSFADGKIVGEIPAEAVGYYYEITSVIGADSCVSTSVYTERAAK